MKLEFPKIKIDTSRKFEAESFSLGDMRVIMELLSSKIYARPKYIIVQEVASNARDANREVGRENVPIQIKLPNRLDDNLIIADSGPGISPDRMSDVFLKYGESTKRADNVLTGGFGIGAKTPFTYTDTFNVVTVTDDEDGKRHQRTYIAHKTTDGGAQMSLVDTRESTEETGTAISFAVERKDFVDFQLAAQEVCRYWPVRPVIAGISNFAWPPETTLHKGDGWSLASERNKAKVLVDGIPYSLRLETVFGNDRNTELYKVLSQGSIRMYFKTGEIEVSATREDLDYKDKTIQAIKDRAEQCLTDLRKKVEASVSTATSLWEASIQWQENSSDFRQFLVKPKWKGQKLLESSYGCTGGVYTKELKGYKGKAEYIYMRDHMKVTNFIKDGTSIVSKKQWGSSIDRNLKIAKYVLLIEDDENKSRPNKLRLQTVFENNPKATEICVVLFKTPESRLFAESVLRWSQLPTSVLSSHPKAKKPKLANGKTRTINAVKTLGHSSARKGWSKQWIPCPDRSPEDGKGGIYVILKDGKPWLSNKTVVSKESVEQIFNEIDRKQVVYGILWKYRNKIDSSWTEVFAEAQKKVVELKAKPNVATYVKYGNVNHSADLGDNLARIIRANEAWIDDKDVAGLLAIAKLASKASGDYNQYCQLARRIGETPDVAKNEFIKTKGKIFKKYPLLERFEQLLYHHRHYGNSNDKTKNDLITKDLIFYLNAKFAASSAAVKGATNANP